MSGGLRWPEDQLFSSPDELASRASACEPAFRELLDEMRIEADLGCYLESLYLPLAAWLARRRAQQSSALVVGLCGGQGSGKSTVAALLKGVLERSFDQRALCFSIDDIYKTREDRQQLAETVHPLFATRGVPFTHDVELGIDTIDRLRAQRPGQSTAIPAFDKAIDTRKPQSEWPICEGTVDVVVFEGWCVGARPQSDQQLEAPINELERDEDPEGIWRRHSNEALASAYRPLFDKLEVLLMLQVDSMQRVFEWRRLQEHKLAEKAHASGADLSTLSVMSDAEVDRFIMHYERLTRHILSEMPSRADIVFPLGPHHNPISVEIRRPIE